MSVSKCTCSLPPRGGHLDGCPEQPPQVEIVIKNNGRISIPDARNVRLVNEDGEKIPFKKTHKLTLCGCSLSQSKPFCDGSHKKGS